MFQCRGQYLCRLWELQRAYTVILIATNNRALITDNLWTIDLNTCNEASLPRESEFYVRLKAVSMLPCPIPVLIF